MNSIFALVQFFWTNVLAKGGVGSSNPNGGLSSTSSSGADSYSQAVAWTPYLLSQFILSITFGVLTLFGGGYWLAKHYNPATKAAGLTKLMWATWITWGLSITSYIFAGFWTASLAPVRDIGGDFNQLSVAWVAPAFENLATAGWMTIILAHAYTIWKMGIVEVEFPRRTIFIHCSCCALLITSALLGVVAPAMTHKWNGSGRLPENVRTTQWAYVRLTGMTPCFLLGVVLSIRLATRRVQGFKSIDPLRWLLFIVVPIWIMVELARMILIIIAVDGSHPVLEVLKTTRLYVSTVPSLVMFGIASLATIAALPFAVVVAKVSEEVEV